jgi:hypothetical protein
MRLLPILILAVFLAGCKGPVAISDACGVIKKTLYADGRFKLSEAEFEALTHQNRVKLSSVVRYYRSCPK